MRLVAAPEDATGDSLKNDTPRLLDDAQAAEAAPVEQLAERTPTLLVAFLRFAEKHRAPSRGPPAQTTVRSHRYAMLARKQVAYQHRGARPGHRESQCRNNAHKLLPATQARAADGIQDRSSDMLRPAVTLSRLDTSSV